MFLKSFFTVSSCTAITRILGLVREIMLSHVLGAGVISDAFVAAFKFPNFFRRFLGEGALNNSFVPYFSHQLAEGGYHKSRESFNKVFTALFLTLIFIVIFFELFSPTIVKLFAPGFCKTKEKFEMSLLFTRITFPYVIFVSLYALLTGVLNNFKRFAEGALAPSILTIFMIAALLMQTIFHFKNPGIILSIAVIVGGFFQLLFVYVPSSKLGYSFKFERNFWSDDVKNVTKKMVPGILGASAVQINMFVDMVLASLLETGTLTCLYYADRLIQLPFGIFGFAIGTSILPQLSKFWKLGKFQEAENMQKNALVFSLMLTLPCTIILLVLSEPIVNLIFGHGLFKKTQTTSYIVSAYAFGLPAAIAVRIFSTIFFSRGDTKTPVRASLVSIIFNITFSCIFMKFFGGIGIAIATSIASWINVSILLLLLGRKKIFGFNSQYLKILGKIFLSSVFAFFALCFLKKNLGIISFSGYLNEKQIICEIVNVAFYCSFSIICFCVFIVLFFRKKTLQIIRGNFI